MSESKNLPAKRASKRKRYGAGVPGPLRSVGTALIALDCLSRSPEPLAVRELADQLNLRKSTVHRILQTLSAAGFLRQPEDTERYTLGPKILEIAARFQSGLKFRRLARPHLERLRQSSGETVFLSILEGIETVLIDRVDSLEPLRMVAEVGTREPAHCTGMGKVLLAGLNDQQVENLLHKHKLEKFTGRTVTTAADLKKELERVRMLGYALDDEEFLSGVRCVAAPIRDSHARIVGGVSVSGPSFRIDEKRLPKLTTEVLETALAVSEELGYSPDSPAQGPTVYQQPAAEI